MSVHQRLALPEKETVNQIRYCSLSGAPVHRTVNSNMSGAPTASSSREGNCQSDLLLFTVRCATGQSGAPTNREGWELPNEALTTPRPFGTIKGTPRRLQQEQ
jgi:hypothetical protein